VTNAFHVPAKLVTEMHFIEYQLLPWKWRQ